uniref:Uncharacterized protein n=1 Tax=Anguilla anguilla TaxID=7936 RepID=A0A0E9R118_ANGAN
MRLHTRVCVCVCASYSQWPTNNAIVTSSACNPLKKIKTSSFLQHQT